MNVPSIARLGLLPDTGNDIRVAADWVCDHAVLVECIALEDDCDGVGGFEVVFEPDFVLDDEDGGDLAEELLALIDHDDDDDDDEEDDWPY